MHGKVLYFSYHYKIRCNEIFYSPALGDPLIKGLTEVANARPKDPVTYLATYLYNFASKNKAEKVYVWLKQWTNWILQDIIALTKSSALFFFTLTLGIWCPHYTWAWRRKFGKYREWTFRWRRRLSSKSSFRHTWIHVQQS